MWTISILHQPDRNVRWIVALTDGRTDILFAASSPAHIVAQLRKVRARRGIAYLHAYPGSPAHELLPHEVTAITRHTGQQERADWLLLVAVARISLQGAVIRTRDVTRVLATIDVRGTGPGADGTDTAVGAALSRAFSDRTPSAPASDPSARASPDLPDELMRAGHA